MILLDHELKVPVSPQTSTHLLGCPTEFCLLPQAPHPWSHHPMTSRKAWPLLAPPGSRGWPQGSHARSLHLSHLFCKTEIRGSGTCLLALTSCDSISQPGVLVATLLHDFEILRNEGDYLKSFKVYSVICLLLGYRGNNRRCEGPLGAGEQRCVWTGLPPLTSPLFLKSPHCPALTKSLIPKLEPRAAFRNFRGRGGGGGEGGGYWEMKRSRKGLLSKHR